MKRFSKISIDDIKTIQVDSGVLLKEFDVENPIFLPENVICATSGGINPVCVPEYYDFGEDVDNVKSAKETKRIRGWNATISFTTLTTSLAAIKLALGAADISGKALSLRQRLQYAKDFKDIWWVGKRADDKLIAIRLIRSLSDSGFSLQTNKRGKGQISVTLKGHSSFAEKDKIPMEVYIFAESDIPIVPDEPDTPTTAMYLYGTPSETGNIGLRVGETVTYYDGWVLSKLPETDFQYAYIHSRGVGDGYRLVLTKKRCKLEKSKKQYGELIPHYHTPLTVTDDSKTIEGRTYLTTSDNDIELKLGTEDLLMPNGLHISLPIIWSNYDFRYYDGEVYVATSPDPIPVSGIVGYHHGIDGLPMLPVWDMEQYPYAIIRERYKSNGTLNDIKLFFYAADASYSVDDYGNLYFGNTGATIYELSGGVWEFSTNADNSMLELPKSEGNTSGGVRFHITWANFRIEYDGTVYKEASETIPIYEIKE